MDDCRAAVPDFSPVIPAKAGIQKAADAGGEPKIAVRAEISPPPSRRSLILVEYRWEEPNRGLPNHEVR